MVAPVYKGRKNGTSISLYLLNLRLKFQPDETAMHLKLLTGLLLLTISSGIIPAKAAPVQSFSNALQTDSLAEISFAEGDMRKSISLWLEAAEIADRYARTEEDSLSYSGFLQSLGVCYRRISMMDSTLHYYNRAWDIIRYKNSPHAVSEKTRLLTGMAILLTFMGRDKESMEYAERAMEMAEGCSDMEMVMYAATNAGGIYARNGYFDKGSKALHTALAKAGESGLPDKQLSALTIMTSMFNIAGERDSTDFYMARAEKLADRLPPESVAVLGFLETQAAVLRNMGCYAESNAIYSRLMSASGQNSSVGKDAGYLTMARNYADMKQFGNAMAYYAKAYPPIATLHNEDIPAQVSEWSAKYGAAEKELEISRLSEEAMRNKAELRGWIIIALVLAVALAGGIVAVILRRRHLRKEEELRLARTYIEGLEKERARVARDLHDGVCNDLLGIGMLVSAMGNSTSAPKNEILSMLESLRSEVRTISHDMMPPSFNLSDIEEVMEMYVRRFRSQTAAEIDFRAILKGSAQWQQVPERIAYEVYRIFQEQMANIIKHSGAGRIEAGLELSDNSLSLTVRHDGKAFSGNRRESGDGIGLSVMSERAKAIGAAISDTEEDGTHVFRLEVPVSISDPE